MTTNKGDVLPQETGVECCMCGDSGLSYELFQCKICHFRSQHRYCSNLYPKAESYSVCNWCLSQKENSKEKSQNSSNSLSSSPNTSEDENKSKKKTQTFRDQGGPENQMKIKTSPIKKQRPPSPEEPPTRRRRLIRLEEKLRRTKSEEISNRGVITRYVFRNKVRRYKLLDEVSS